LGIEENCVRCVAIPKKEILIKFILNICYIYMSIMVNYKIEEDFVINQIHAGIK